MGRVGNQSRSLSMICRVGERDGVWQAGLLSVRCYETAVDPVINHPQADAVSLANLIDVECSGGKRRTGNAMLVTDPAYHGDCEGPAGCACKALVLEQCDDLVVVVDGCESADSVNECIGITNGFYTVWRQVNSDCFRRAALPTNAQLQKL